MSRFVMRGDVEVATFDWGPAAGPGGYAAADVSGDEPWVSAR